jgi:hypothetical protein
VAESYLENRPRRLRHRGRAALQGRVTKEAKWASAPVVDLGLAQELKPLSKAACRGAEAPLFHGT